MVQIRKTGRGVAAERTQQHIQQSLSSQPITNGDDLQECGSRTDTAPTFATTPIVSDDCRSRQQLWAMLMLHHVLPRDGLSGRRTERHTSYDIIRSISLQLSISPSCYPVTYVLQIDDGLHDGRQSGTQQNIAMAAGYKVGDDER